MFSISKSTNKQFGFSTLDSLFAIALIGSLIVLTIVFNQHITNQKEAKQLANETDAFAKIYARYLNNNYSQILTNLNNGMVVIGPQIVQATSDAWPIELANSNMLGQIPCITVAQNLNTGKLEAVMYYVDDKTNVHNIDAKIVRTALIMLGNKGGIVTNDTIEGNSGWKITSGSNFLTNVNQCGGGGLINNSLAVNLDMLPEWDQDLQPSIAISKAIDKGNPNNTATLPGHILNSNTSKANIYFSGNNGVILDNSNPNNPIKLSIQDNGVVTGSPTVGLGQNNLATVTADTIQPSQLGRAGDSCRAIEIGKTIADRGSSVTSENQVLARNTLVCTKNPVLCNNSDNTCYLPSIANNVIYQNNTQGIQNSTGIFICPKAVPFASNPKYALLSNGYYYSTSMDNTIGCVYALNTDGGCWRPPVTNNEQCPLPFSYQGGCGGYSGTAILEFGNESVAGAIHSMSFNNIGGSAIESTIIAKLAEFNVPIGYQISTTALNINCDTVCSQLPAISNGIWNKAVDRPSFSNTNYGPNSCGCWNTSPGQANALAIVVLQQPKAIITNTTCSNMPNYIQQN